MKGLSKRLISLLSVGTMIFTYCSVLPTQTGDFTDSISVSASSKTVSISKCKITLSSSVRVFRYGKDMNNPVVTVKYGSKKLKQGTDYKLKYTNVSNVGTGKVTITGCGKFSGSTSRTFKIVALSTPVTPSVSSTSNSVTLSWKKVEGAGKYVVQRYNSSKKKYENIYTGTSLKFTDKKRKSSTSYKYRLVAYRTINKKTYSVYSPTVTKSTTGTENPKTTSFQNEVISFINAERQKQSKIDKVKRYNLTANAELNQLAMQRTTQVASNLQTQNRKNLNSSDHKFKGKSIGDMLNEVKYNWFVYRKDRYFYGENLAVGQKTPAEVVKTWMNSPAHRKNILDPNFRRVGIGYKVINGRTYWVQDFTS